MNEAICPECKTQFDPKKHRKYAGIKADFTEHLQRVHTPPEKWIDESSLVSCPKCGNEFISDSVRFLGVLSPKGLKIFLTLFVLSFLCAALYLVFVSIVKF